MTGLLYGATALYTGGLFGVLRTTARAIGVGQPTMMMTSSDSIYGLIVLVTRVSSS
jgi:hypothetical protein